MNRLLSLGLIALAALLLALAALIQNGGQDSTALFVALAGGFALSVGALLHHPLAGAAASAGYGAVLSGYLALQHHTALNGGRSACNVSELFNCDLVNTSSYSEAFGVPIALYGLGFYVAIGAVAALGWRKVAGYDRAAGLVLAAGAAGTLVAVLLAGASLTLGAWCILCISTYGTSILLLVAGLQAGGSEHLGAALAGAKDRSLMSALALGIAALFLGFNRYQGLEGSAADRVAEQAATPSTSGEQGPPQYELLYEQTGGPILLGGEEPSWGVPEAPVVVVEYADYQCPHCAMMAKELKRISSVNPDMRILFKHYPLSNLCNNQIPSAGHDQACYAASAAVCAQQQGRFWELNEQMFVNQDVLEPGNIGFLARQIGLDMTAFDACVGNPATVERVKRDVAHGVEAGVRSTPSLYVQGLQSDPKAWVKVTSGHEGLELLLRARKGGIKLPAAGPSGSTEPH